jgi:hypothetical protein
MNYAIAAYEHGLHQLLEQMGKDHPKYATVLLLQAGLQKNFNETRYSDDSEKRSLRINMIAHLNDLTRQVIGISFIELCISSNPALAYIMAVQSLAQDAYDLFSAENEIWSDQCLRVISALYKIGPLPEVKNVSKLNMDIAADLLMMELSSIRDRLEELELLIRGFSNLSQKSSNQVSKQRQQIKRKLALLLQRLEQINNSSDEFINKYEEEVRLSKVSTNPSQSEVLSQPPQSILPTGQDNWFDPINIDSVKLRRAMQTAYNLAEIEIFCDELKVSYDNLDGTTLEMKIYHLLGYCKRHNRYEDLVRKVLIERKHLIKDLL